MNVVKTTTLIMKSHMSSVIESSDTDDMKG